MTEADLQKQIITWCRASLKTEIVYWATSNERKARPQYMVTLKKMGCLAGVSDLIFLTINGPIFLELKRPTTHKIGKSGKRIIAIRGGVQSDAQKEFQTRVEALGFKYIILDDFDGFVEFAKINNLTKGN